jgi:hypothetical protein
MWSKNCAVEVLELFVDVHLAHYGQWANFPMELRITNRRRDNETTSEFRRQKRESSPGTCRCGAHFPPAHGRAPRTRCVACQRQHLATLRAIRDRGRKR